MHDIAGIPFPHSCTGKAKVLTRFISCCVDGPCRTACNILQTALHCPALFHHLRQKIDLFIPVIGLQKQTKQRMPLNILLCDTLLNSRQYPFQKLCIARPLIGIAGVDQPHTDTGTGYCWNMGNPAHKPLLGKISQYAKMINRCAHTTAGQCQSDMHLFFFQNFTLTNVCKKDGCSTACFRMKRWMLM